VLVGDPRRRDHRRREFRSRDEEVDMARYLLKARYASEGAQGVLRAGGTARRTAVEELLTGLGGRLESFDFAFGEDDLYVVCELPGNSAAAAVALTVNAAGLVQVQTVVLLTPEEVDEASRQQVAYTPPGRS
jgi:uncharacterized protein with GYD domain